MRRATRDHALTVSGEDGASGCEMSLTDLSNTANSRRETSHHFISQREALQHDHAAAFAPLTQLLRP